MRLRIQSFPRPLRGTFKFTNHRRSKSCVVNGRTHTRTPESNYHGHAIQQSLSPPKNYQILNHRSYSIASTASSASSGSSSKDSSKDSSTSTSATSDTSSAVVKMTSKEEEQEMELLLETAFTQAKEISQIAIERRALRLKMTDSALSSDTSSKSPLPSSQPDLVIPFHNHISNSSISSSSSSRNSSSSSSNNNSNSNRNDNINISIKNKNEEDPTSEFSSKNQKRQESSSNSNIIDVNVRITEKMMDIEFEASAAEALLKLTSHPNFQHAFIQKQRQQQREIIPSGKGTTDTDTCTDNNVVLSLHQAFLSVIHWLCNTTLIQTPNNSSLAAPSKTETLPLPSKESILLSHILSLTERSKALNLPLTLPLYECISTLIARHNNFKLDDNNSSGLSLLLLDVSILARDALLPPPATTTMVLPDKADSHNRIEDSQFIKASFFANTLKELLQRNQFRDMIQLLHGIKNVHNIKNVVDLNTGMDLLSSLKDKVDIHVKSDHLNESTTYQANEDNSDSNDLLLRDGDESSSNDNMFDETDAMELAMILQTPVMEELSMRRKELNEYELGGTIDNLLDKQISDDKESDDFDDEEWDDATVYDDYDDYQFTEGDENINTEVDYTNQSLNHFSSTQYDSKGQDTRDDIEDESEKLNDLVKFMENNIHDRGAKEAAESAAVALMNKISNTTKNIADNEKSRTTNESSVIQKNGTGTRTDNSEIHARFHVNSSTGEIEKAEFAMDPIKSSERRPTDHSHNSMMKDVIYIRDSTWEIPDVVPQLEEWNSNAGLFFSKDYETELLKEMTNEHYDDDFLDDTGKDGE